MDGSHANPSVDPPPLRLGSDVTRKDRASQVTAATFFFWGLLATILHPIRSTFAFQIVRRDGRSEQTMVAMAARGTCIAKAFDLARLWAPSTEPTCSCSL